MILYNRFLLDPLGDAPISHILFTRLTYIGSPHLLIGPTIRFTTTPEKDVLDLDDLAGAYETLVEEFLRNRQYSRSHTVVHVETWSYPIPEEKYLPDKFLKIKKTSSETLGKSPVKNSPVIKVEDYDLPSGIKIIPHSTMISETIDGITTMAELFTKNNRLYAKLIPPDLGMSTPYYFSLNLKHFRNKIIQELIEKYLDGLSVPDRVKIHTTDDGWIGKTVIVDTLRARVVKLLIHKHRNVHV